MLWHTHPLLYVIMLLLYAVPHPLLYVTMLLLLYADTAAAVDRKLRSSKRTCIRYAAEALRKSNTHCSSRTKTKLLNSTLWWVPCCRAADSLVCSMAWCECARWLGVSVLDGLV